jgi:hypothetical protein
VHFTSDCTVFKVAALTAMVYPSTEKDLNVIGGEKRGVGNYITKF